MALRGGIDLGGTKIQAAIVDENGQVSGDARNPTPTQGGPNDVAAAMATTLRQAAEAAKQKIADLDGVGVGSPGSIDHEAGTVSHASNLPDWGGTFPLGPALSDELGVPVQLGNDVSVATHGEFEFGAGKPYDSLLGVFWGTGVGGGLILNGELWEGRGAAGEIGHTVVEVAGAKCPCGRRGCVEAYAGRGAMEARARKKVKNGAETDLFDIMDKKHRTRLTSGIWARALAREDSLAQHLVDRAVRALGAGVASAVNLLDVEAVVIGGGLGVRLGDPYAGRIRAEMLPHLFNDDRPPEVHVAALGDLGGAIGASLLV